MHDVLRMGLLRWAASSPAVAVARAILTNMDKRELYTDAYMDSMRVVGDPPADAVIASLYSAGDAAVQQANLLLRDLVDNDDIPAQSLPVSLRELLGETQPPSWANPQAIEEGSLLFLRHGPQMITLLNVYSLPLTYTAKKGVQVLARTNRLNSNATRRVVETAQMVIDVMSPGGLALDPHKFGSGVRSAQKVRLMHAAIRHLIKTRDPSWKETDGVPINQEDMAGTLLCFSTAIIDGLERMGIQLTRQEQEAYCHCWRVIGHFMGVYPEMCPEDLGDARTLAERMLTRQEGACPEGQQLTQSLIQTHEHLLPGNVFDGVPVRLMRYFVGDARARLLGLPEHAPVHAHSGMLRLLSGLVDTLNDETRVVRQTSELFGRGLLQGLLFAFRGPRRQPFDLPTALRQEWGMNWRAL